MLGGAPLEKVKTLMTEDGVARKVADAFGKADAKIVRAALEAFELVQRGHIQRFEILAEGVEKQVPYRPVIKGLGILVEIDAVFATHAGPDFERNPARFKRYPK